MINWMPCFFKEIEKRSNLMGVAMAGMAGYDLKSRTKEEFELNRAATEPVKQQSEQLQLPGSNAYDFAGGKRIDSSSAMTAVNKY
jgi:hypothetical protein